MRARDNPFSSDRIEAVSFRFGEGAGRERLLSRLEALQFRGCIWGPEGSGKTTLLEQLARDLAARFGVHQFSLNEEDRTVALPRCGGQDLVLVDSADLLERRDFERLSSSTRAAGGLVVTSHRPGLLPTLYECRTSPQLLREIVRDLAGPLAADRFALDQVYEAHAGDLRRALRHLYDICAATA